MAARGSDSADKNKLLPTLIDERARSDPERLYCAIFKTLDVGSLSKVTYSNYANAINRCARWLEETLGRRTGFPTIAYLGPTDIRYSIVTLAAVKTGYKALLLTFRNSIAAQLKLLEATDCKFVLTTIDFPAFDPLIAAIVAQRPMEHVRIESLDFWLQGEKVPEYPFHATLDQNPTRPFVVLQTSGSTGFPTPVTYTFSTISTYRKFLRPEKTVSSASRTSLDVWRNVCSYIAFPVFHMIGAIGMTALNVYLDASCILGPPNVLPTPEFLTAVHNLDMCQSSILPPSIMQELVQKPEYLEGLRKLKSLTWGGGPFSSCDVPEKLRSYVPIYTGYGSTEAGILPLTIGDQEDYEYMEFSPLVGATFRHHSDDLYELVIKRDEKLHDTQLVFFNFPELDEWPTRDLFSKHSTKPLWRYRERCDDIIALSNSLMISPSAMENIVVGHPDILSAILVGKGVRVAWLIEVLKPPLDKTEESLLIENIWPVIEKANQIGPIQARVTRDRLIITTKEKPMLRGIKGTVQRQLTRKLYEADLTALDGLAEKDY